MQVKKKLFWQIFPSFIIITLLSLAAVTSYSTSYFKKIFLNSTEKELTIRTKILQKKFINFISSNIELAEQNSEQQQSLNINHRIKNAKIDQQCKEIGQETGTRVTVILSSGVVVGDSYADIDQMENHRMRPEIRQALKRAKGVSMRYSATLDEDMMYIALPIMKEDSLLAVVRTAISISTVDKEINTIRNRIFLAFLFTIIAAAMVSLYVTRRITRPIEEMKKGAARFAGGDLDTRLAVPASEELSQLAVTMNRMAENLDEKIKAFKSRSMELEAVHTSMQEGVIAIDKDERIITVNDAAADIFSFPSTILKGRFILEVVRNVEFQSFIQRALATHEPVEDDIVLEKEDDLILNIHSTALYDNNRFRLGTLIIFHDISRIRRLETMHKDFAANVSHELKTPLTAIKGFIETLQAMMVSKDTEQTEHFLQIIDKNVNRMIDLINDLLALSKLERLEGTDIHFEKQQLHTLIQAAVNTCQVSMKEKQISLSIDCQEDLIVMVDPVLMEQAIINLVDNAIKYSPANSCITIRAKVKESCVSIIFQDQGNGIDSDHLQKIFNRFYRVDKARSRHEGGTGLGLAIVKHIVQYHQGTINVTSIKNQGSCFTISLPIV